MRQPRRLVLRGPTGSGDRAHRFAGSCGTQALHALPVGAVEFSLSPGTLWGRIERRGPWRGSCFRRRAGDRAGPRQHHPLKTIGYLHGFISSPQSKKAVMLGDYVKNCVAGVDYLVPSLHHRPKRAMGQIEAACRALAPAGLTVLGSSLGGFYATVVAE